MRKGWNILEMNVGREPAIITVFDNGLKRPVVFRSKTDAKEAQRLINRYRNDTAYVGTTLKRET